MHNNYFRCVDNANTINMEISSSSFENNSGVHGGAIYISKSESEDNVNSIVIEDTSFTNNKAEDFGGAIYSDFDIFNINNIENVKFEGNTAYAGGSFYLKNDNIDIDNTKSLEVLKNTTKIQYINNKSDSHGENYGTNPIKIELMTNIPKIVELKSGDVIQLKFNMTDKYGQIVKDISRLYSSIGINIELDEETLNDDNEIQKKLKGSTCYFTNGIQYFYHYYYKYILFIL